MKLYTIGLRNKKALCLGISDKIAQGAGIAQKDKVMVENVEPGYIVSCKAIIVHKPTEAPKTAVEEKPPETAVATQ